MLPVRWYNSVFFLSLVILLAGIVIDVSVLLLQVWAWAKVAMLFGFIVVVLGAVVLE